MVYSFILRVIYIFIAIYNLEAEIFDIVTTYLNADIFENIIIYIRQPYRLDDNTGCVCRLKKVLYGLCSSPKWWYDTIVLMFKGYGFEVFVLNICYFINKDKSIFFCLYIDNIIVAVPIKMLIA